MQAHQIISIVEGDFSDCGAARVSQVGVTVVDRESAETYEGVQRIIIHHARYLHEYVLNLDE